MRRLITLLFLLSISFINAQAFTGKNDNKIQVGANFQGNGTGINVSYDYGLGENISVGISSTYLLGVDETLTNFVNDDLNANFDNRIDVRARFNANLGSIISNDSNFDIYPGLSVGLKNFGGHLGTRYFLSDGFGFYLELNTPLAKYKTGTLTATELLHNEFSFNLGASFNI